MLLTGIIGYPLEVTLSPAMHNAAFRALGIAGEYRRIPTPPDQVTARIDELERAGFRGLNVTIPHKEAVLAALDEVREPAKTVGAVNTISFEQGRRIGFNTDIPGLIDALAADNIGIRNRRVMLIGAGGAARAYLYALDSLQPAELFITNRSLDRAQRLAVEFDAVCVPFADYLRLAGEMDVTVNATAVDLQAETIPHLRPGAVYYDANYKFPLQPTQAARNVNGLLMLALQGAHSFRIWTDRQPPLEVMKKAIGLV